MTDVLDPVVRDGSAARVVEAPCAVDRLVFHVPDVMATGVDEDELVPLFRGYLEEAAHRNALVARRLDDSGFDPAQLDGLGDLARVPLIPTTAFKRRRLLLVGEDELVASFSSSGTSGRRSYVGRDEPTLYRLVGSLRRGFEMAGASLGLDDDEEPEESLFVVNLGPDRAGAGDVWFSYVMALADALAPSEHFWRDGSLRLADAAAAAAVALRDGRKVAVCGPPGRVLALAEHARLAFPRFAGGHDVVVVIGGGWKGERPVAPAELRAAVVDGLGLAAEHQVRDAFNQVELNTVLFECEHFRKHVPPWVHVEVKDPASLEPLGPGEAGLLGYVDVTATSYPCLVLTEDLGWREERGCPCGRATETIAVHGRIASSLHRGCAAQLAD